MSGKQLPVTGSGPLSFEATHTRTQPSKGKGEAEKITRKIETKRAIVASRRPKHKQQQTSKKETTKNEKM